MPSTGNKKPRWASAERGFFIAGMILFSTSYRGSDMAKKTVSQRFRNPLHDHPLMRKGGVHDKTNKQKRKSEKWAWRKQWCSSTVLAGAV